MRKLLPVVFLFILASCYKKDTDPNSLNAVDKQFMNFVFRSNLEEIENGQLALNKSSHPLVRQFAQEAIQHYTNVQNDLRQVVRSVGYTLTDTSIVQIQSLQDHSGYSFDTAYISSRFKNHQYMLEGYRQELNEGNHTYIRHYFLNRHLDGVRHYFYKADSISRQM
jgi:putative membrane protein